MSVRVMTWVWQSSRSAGVDRLVLLAIADCASDDGSNAYPSLATLKAKTALAERTVQRAIGRLVDLGELLVQWQKGPHGANRYTVVTTAAGVSESHPVAESPRQADTPSHSHPVRESPDPRRTVTPTPVTESPEPSLNRHEPSVRTFTSEVAT